MKFIGVLSCSCRKGQPKIVIFMSFSSRVFVLGTKLMVLILKSYDDILLRCVDCIRGVVEVASLFLYIRRCRLFVKYTTNISEIYI